MTNPHQREVAVFEAALQLPPEQREAYLDQTCGGDLELRRRINALLKAHQSETDVLEPTTATLGASFTRDVLPAEKPGDKIGPYKLLQQIGEGGCGVVYMAEQDKPIRRRVALKIIKLGMDTKQVVARFDAERQALALMDHPNIAKIFDAGITGGRARHSVRAGVEPSEGGAQGTDAPYLSAGRPFFVMELVRGVKITDYCDQNNLSTQERLDLFIQVCHAVQHAHQKGVIHRDLKPSNILVTVNDGVAVPKVIDFGIAKATQGRLTDQTVFTAFEQFIGTPAYMSPEQAVMTSVDIDTRSDIYSLGVLLYELLTGKTPFDQKELLAAGLDEMRRTIREKEPPKPSTRLTQELVTAPRQSAAESGDKNGGALPRRRYGQIQEFIHLIRGDLDWIVMKCLEKDRARRYETANGLAADIRRHLTCEPVIARPSSKLYEFQKTVRRHKFGFAATGAVIVALLLGLGMTTWSLVKERRERQRAVAAEVKARSEAAKSQQVAQFFEDMLKGVGPEVAKGRDTTILKEILDKTAQRIGTELTNQPDVEAQLRYEAGNVYYDLGDYEGSELMLRQAVAIRRTLGSKESIHLAAALTSLAWTLWTVGKSAEAETNINAALAIQRSQLGSEHPDVGKSLNVLFAIRHSQRKYQEAETFERKALAIEKKAYGETNRAVATSLDNLAIALDGEGKLPEAEAMHRESLAIYRRLLDYERPDVAFALYYLASNLSNQGKQEEAEKLAREALQMRSKILGNDHPDVADSLKILVGILKKERKFAEAEDTTRQWLALHRKSLGDSHWMVANDVGLLAGILADQKKFDEAGKLLDEFLSPATGAQTNSAMLFKLRGGIYGERAMWKEAAVDLQQALDLRPTDSMGWYRLASALIGEGDLVAYRECCRNMLKRYGATSQAKLAATIARACLISPSNGADMNIIGKLADVASASSTNHAILEIECTKELAEYRAGRFRSAKDWARHATEAPEFNSNPGLQVETYAVLAMAQHQLQQSDAAQATLARGIAVEAQLPKIESGDLGKSAFSRVVEHALLHEAEMLIEGVPAPPQTKDINHNP